MVLADRRVELALGHLVFGADWARLTQDYDPRGGWLALGLLVPLFAPRIGARMRALG